MTVFLTSSPSGPLDNSRPVNGLDDMNRFVINLKERWPEQSRILYISADPLAFGENDWICRSMAETFRSRGFGIKEFHVWDNRRAELSEEELARYDVLILGGGHVPTQNAFFQKIYLREKTRTFDGLVIGISAGTMNAADVVYAQPEHEGESIDQNYIRFPIGLGLTNINVLPHYQMVKDSMLDGRRLYEDITYADSYGREFLALCDGSFLLIEKGKTLLYGEAYRIMNGRIERLSEENQIIQI